MDPKYDAIKYVRLGQTGLEVSELCHGTLILGPLQGDVPRSEGAAALRRALEHGINFFDTAELYGTYGHLREALQGRREAGGRPLVVASKSLAKSGEEARRAVEQGLRKLRRERFEIFLLHNVNGPADLEARTGALEYLRRARDQGLVGHLGLSTHSVAGVRAGLPLPDLEVLLPILNRAGRGLRQGTMAEMVDAAREAYAAGKGVYAMKALAGGHLGPDFQAALTWVRELGCLHSVAVGMKSPAEVDLNVAVFEGRPVPPEASQLVYRVKRVKPVSTVCTGCGSCVAICPAGALSLAGGKAVCDHEQCVLCGYCGEACPSFAIRLV
jgi:aryl-alcohol dehydrogenase-like predicted oxidoreductase